MQIPASNSANINMQIISETQKKNKLGNQQPKKAKLTPPPPPLNAGWDDADGDNDLGGMDDQGVIRDWRWNGPLWVLVNVEVVNTKLVFCSEIFRSKFIQ